MGAEDEDDNDPVLDAFLSFMDDQMAKRPELIQPFTRADVEGLDDLLDGVEVGLDDELDDDFVLP